MSGNIKAFVMFFCYDETPIFLFWLVCILTVMYNWDCGSPCEPTTKHNARNTILSVYTFKMYFNC